jgi:hypothetical protein
MNVCYETFTDKASDLDRYDLSNERGTRDLVSGMLGAFTGQVHVFRKWDVGVWTGLGWLRIETGGEEL